MIVLLTTIVSKTVVRPHAPSVPWPKRPFTSESALAPVPVAGTTVTVWVAVMYSVVVVVGSPVFTAATLFPTLSAGAAGAVAAGAAVLGPTLIVMVCEN